MVCFQTQCATPEHVEHKYRLLSTNANLIGDEFECVEEMLFCPMSLINARIRAFASSLSCGNDSELVVSSAFNETD